MYSFIRTIFFCVFFAIGFGAMSLSFLAEELDVYYNNLRYKEYIDYQIKILEDRRVVYDDKLTLLYGDPEIKYRLGRVIFGVEPKKEATVFPEPGEELKDESISAVKDVMGQMLVLTPKPQWVKTVNVPQNNEVLLYGGMILVFLSMFFFSEPPKRTDKKKPQPETTGDNGDTDAQNDAEDDDLEEIDEDQEDDEANNHEEDEEEEEDDDDDDDDDDANNYEEDDDQEDNDSETCSEHNGGESDKIIKK